MKKFDIQFFAEQEQPETTPESQTVGEPETKPEEKPEQPEKTFTQAELDEIIAKRIERERKKYEGFEELKKKAEQYEKELEEKRLAEMSEKERAEEIARKAEEQAQQYAKQLEELQSQIKREKVHNAFIAAATAHNIAYVEDALKLAEAELSAVEFGEDGKPVGVEAIVEALVKNKPYLLAQQQPRTIGDASNHAPEQKSEKTAEQLLKEAAEKARKTGRIEDMVAYNKLKKELGK